MSRMVVYVTFPNVEEARLVGRHLVEERLAACVNILADVESMYWWDNQVQDDSEAVLIAKTVSAQFEGLRARIVKMHPYEVPCIVAWPVEHGHEPFLDWISREARGSCEQGDENC